MNNTFDAAARRAASAALMALPCVVAAQPVIGTDLIPNFIGLGVGTTTAYSGADEQVLGVVPGARYQFKGSGRYVEWYGTMADANLLDSATWQIGPVLNLRLGRKDVDDEAVRLLPEIDHTVEGGLMASWTGYGREGGVPWRLRLGATVLADLGGRYSGINSTLFGSFWVPLSPTMFLGLGAGANWVSDDFNRTYYGVGSAGSSASGLAVYTPDGGLRQWFAWPALLVKLTPEWYAGAMVFYQRLTGDAGDSPIVAERGDRNQFTAGVGLGYAWR